MPAIFSFGGDSLYKRIFERSSCHQTRIIWSMLLSSEIRHGPDIEKRYWKDVLWSPSYFAASCGRRPQPYIEGVHRAAENPRLTSERGQQCIISPPCRARFM